MQTLYGYKQMPNGKWRLYQSIPQAITAWRGTNDKITVIRDIYSNQILNFSDLAKLQAYCKERFKTSAYDMKDW